MLNMNDVRELLTRADEHTLTLYMNVDNAARENQSNPAAWRIWVKNTLNQMGDTLQGEAREAWPFIRGWVEDYVRGYIPSAKSLVIVAGPSFQNTYELPMNFENHATFGMPRIGPLLWAIDEFEPYLIVLVDQEKARFFLNYLGSVGFQGSMEVDIADYDFAERTTMSAPGPGIDNAAVHGGTGRDDFEDMLDEFRARFYRGVADRVRELVEEHRVRRIVLGGAERSAHAVQRFLDERLKSKVVGVVGLSMALSPHQILEKVLPLALEFERQQELDLVSQIIDFAKSGGRGALGAKAVREALDMQRVELLVLNWPSDDIELANDLAFRALSLNSGIELVHGDAADLLRKEGNGIGARLYYAL